MVAPINAQAVWPEGNEWVSEPSGRVELTVSLSVLTEPAMSIVAMPCDTAMRPQPERVGNPAALSIQGAARGAYCSQSVPRSVFLPTVMSAGTAG